PERIGWGVCLGLAFLSGSALLASLGGPHPRVCFAILAVAGVAVGRLCAARDSGAVLPPAGERRAARALLWLAAAAGVLLYAVRALIRPMWSIDFLAIWGLKGRTIFAAGAIPPWLSDPRLAGFSHPEYPLGLPLLYAGAAGVVGKWDDHALALLFPAFQIATLTVLFGWLRRRGAGPMVTLAATALLALFEPLYSGFLTGMADVPLSLTMLLLGASLSDAMDGTDSRALARLAVASLLASSIKNEGLFLAGVAASVAILAPRGEGDRPRRLRVAAAAILPAISLTLVVRALRGAAPLRDFDFGLLAPSRFGELLGRTAEAFSADAHVIARSWIFPAAIAALILAGRKTPWAEPLIWLAGAALCVYLALPAFAILGPEWLAETTLFRTAAALVPLAAAGIAGRLSGDGRRETENGKRRGAADAGRESAVFT
ncbi:MAG: hypothetical protein M3S32_04860, partial [Acidobacteriota bacterium]|nr:hypothetical protein [Acidobacteriota bacterium]